MEVKIKVQDGRHNVEYLKATCNIILSYAYEAFSKYPEPKREEFKTEEEYKKAFKDYLLFLVDYVSKVKYNIFSNVLNTYNDSITVERDLEKDYAEFIDKMNFFINRYDANIRRNYIVTLITCLLAPKSSLIFLGLGVFKYVINKNSKKRALIVSKEEKEKLSQFCKEADEIYLFQDDLRTDYHARKDELERFKRMILNGEVNNSNKEEFIGKVRELINPIGYSFTKLDELFNDGIINVSITDDGDVAIEQHGQKIKK